MKLGVETINHVGLVVKDREAAERFYVGILGFEPVPAAPGTGSTPRTRSI